MASFPCTSCRSPEKPLTEGELCADCYEKFKVDIFFIGQWDDATKDIAREFLQPYSPAERAHGLVFVDGVIRFARDPMLEHIWKVNRDLLDNLAISQLRAPSALSGLWYRRFYRGLGYSLCGYAECFERDFLPDDDEEEE